MTLRIPEVSFADKKVTKSKINRTFCQQFGALPYRVIDQGKVEILLVTSRETHQWVFPKGNAMLQRGKPVSPSKVAAIEARQEAGVEGKISNRWFGVVRYNKRGEGATVERCRVTVFVLRVDNVLQEWKEKNQRIRQWFSIDEVRSQLISNSNFPEGAKIAELLRKAEKIIFETAKLAKGGHRTPKKRKTILMKSKIRLAPQND